VRKSLGDPVAEDLRYVMKAAVGEENFIDMIPNRSNNYCCGGGGGFSASRFPTPAEPSAKSNSNRSGRPAPPIASPPATTATPRVHDIAEHSRPSTTRCICGRSCVLAMGVLGENERVYLGPDLADLGL
jgi:hypothetical protein